MTAVPFGTLTTRVPLVVVKSSVPTFTSMVAFPFVMAAGTGGALVGVGLSSPAVVAVPDALVVLAEFLLELDPQADSPIDSAMARTQALVRTSVRPIDSPLDSSAHRGTSGAVGHVNTAEHSFFKAHAEKVPSSVVPLGTAPGALPSTS